LGPEKDDRGSTSIRRSTSQLIIAHHHLAAVLSISDPISRNVHNSSVRRRAVDPHAISAGAATGKLSGQSSMKSRDRQSPYIALEHFHNGRILRWDTRARIVRWLRIHPCMTYGRADVEVPAMPISLPVIQVYPTFSSPGSIRNWPHDTIAGYARIQFPFRIS